MDPLVEKYFRWSPYNYVLGNPIKLIDRDGLDVYLYFHRLHGIITIVNDNDTPDDFSDDIIIDQYPAHNNVVRGNRNWPDGRYNMLDRRTTHRHNNNQDTPNGPYGTNGIYRANEFRDGNFTRRGMGVHSGREHLPFERRVTNGCIRTTPECMDAIQNAIDNFGPLNLIILESDPNDQLLPPRPRPNEPNEERRPIIIIPPLPPINPNPRPLPPDVRA